MSPGSATEMKRAQRAGFFTFLLLGHLVLSSVAWVPEYIERLNVSFTSWGLILSFAPLGTISAIVLAPILINRFGVTPVMRIATLLSAVFLVPLGFTNSPAIWASLNMVFHFLASLAGVSINTHAVLLQKKVTESILSGMHAGWSLGAVGAAATGAIATVLIPLEVYLIGTAIVTIVGFESSARFLLSPANDGHHEEKSRATRTRLSRIPPRLWLLAFGLLCAVMPEIAVLEWSAVLARETGADLILRALPFAAFMVGMITGRLSVNRLSRRFPVHSIAVIGASTGALAMGLGVAGSAMLGSTSATVAVFWLATFWLVGGLGLAPLGPTMISTGSRVPGVTTMQAIGVLSFVAQSVSILAKVLMGAVAEGVNVSAAFAIPVALLAVGALIAHKTSEKTRPTELARANPPTGPLPAISAERQD